MHEKVANFHYLSSQDDEVVSISEMNSKTEVNSPRESANGFSKFFFIWTAKTFRKGEALKTTDLCKISHNDESNILGNKLELYWEREMDRAKKKNVKPSLSRVLIQTSGFDFMIWGFVLFCQLAMRAALPIFLKYFLRLFARGNEYDKENEMYLYGTLMVVSLFLAFAATHHGNFNFGLIGMRCRVAISSLIYRKVTKLSQGTLSTITKGQVVNLLSNDVTRFDLPLGVLHAFWIMPFFIAFVSYFIWLEVGISCLSGVIALLLINIPLHSYLGKLTGNFRFKIAKKTDYRVRIMNEIISGIQVIKMYTWEKPFERILKDARKSEISDVTITSYFRGIYACGFQLASIGLCLTLICYVLLGNRIASDVVFSVTLNFYNLHLAFAVYYPLAFAHGSETLAAVERLRDFLMLEDKSTEGITISHQPSVSINEVSASWDTSLPPTLNKISLHIPQGTLCTIISPVGSGKTSLLQVTKLSQGTLSTITKGQVVNLLSNDVTRFDLPLGVLHAFWIMPFFIAFVSYFIWLEVGISCLSGVIALLLINIPLHSYLGKLTGNFRFKIAKKTDYRVRIMNEIISGIQVIKMYTWEKPFERILKDARKSEISDVTITSYFRGIYACGFQLASIGLCLTLICYVLLGNRIASDVVFSVTLNFYNLHLAFAVYYPLAFAHGSETLAAVERLRDFLMLEDKSTEGITISHQPSVSINEVSASWDTSLPPTLNKISLHIPQGTLCTIISPVGSGKTSLLQLLLGELTIISGQLSISDKLSYAAQEPWLFSASVRDNILFGEPFIDTWYDEVINACALKRDFEEFPNGDNTMVGDRGVLLSGGQKVRINLARAVYRESCTYLLDDPLSAVDTKVGKHIFNECICNLLAKRTRIVVTHQLQYVKKADLIVVMEKGGIKATGTYEELMNSNLDFTEFISTSDVKSEMFEKEIITNKLSTEKISSSALSKLEKHEENLVKKVVLENEEKSGSDPNISPFLEYIKAVQSISLMAILLVSIFATQGASSSAEYWIAFWTAQEEIRYSYRSYLETIPDQNSSNQTISSTISFPNSLFDTVITDQAVHTIIKTNIACYIYGGLIVASIALTIIRSLLFMKMTMIASKNLHAKMFHCLLKAPMNFFNNTTCGRILNRFSKDMGAIDELLPRMLLDSVRISFAVLGMTVITALSNPFSIALIFVSGILIKQQLNYYIPTAKKIKHLEGITKSPVFSHVSSTITGIATIRAARSEKKLTAEFDHYQDTHSSAWFMSIACMYTFTFWLDQIILFFIICLTLSFILLYKFSEVEASVVGLALTQILCLTSSVQYGIQQITEVINELTSVERVLQYTKLEEEGPFESPGGVAADPNWPINGNIEFKKVSLKYVEHSPPVLKDLNLKIEEGEKVGIVGRTGAGKSSLISALFRLTNIEGSIKIDGVDIKTLGLTDLRKRVSIIPQDPLLFSATVRYNLDPFNEFDDLQLWKTLEEVELKKSVPSLNFLISEGGSNFSMGQRQLMCLARAILRNNKILVLDEATANIDLRTESFIQTMIRKKFRDCTVLTIAHRLNNIMDSDKVLVMNYGVNVEFDHPYKLLQDKDGFFSNLVAETGPEISRQLKEAAQESYNKKQYGLHETDEI